MLDPFDQINYMPPLQPRTQISINFGYDREAQEIAEFNASLDELLTESTAENLAIASIAEDDDFEAAVEAAELGFIGPKTDSSPKDDAGGSSSFVASKSSFRKPAEFPELEGDQGRIVMPYDNYYATQILTQQKSLFRTISSRSTWLTDAVGVPAVMGTGSSSSLLRKSIEEKKLKTIRKFRNQFPTSFPETPTLGHTLTADVLRPASLPRWKDKPGFGRATRVESQFLLATQFAGLVAEEAPSILDLETRSEDSTVGFFSLALPVHIHGKVLGPKPANLFHKELIRRVKSIAPNPAGVFAWRRESTDDITLFGMLKGCGNGSAHLAAQAAAGRRFGLAVLKTGLKPKNFRSITAGQWAALYNLDEDVFVDGWANGNDELMRDFAPTMNEAIEFDFSTKEFRQGTDIADKAATHMPIWDDYVTRCGLPVWFGGKMLNVFMDVFVRTEEEASKRRQLLAASEKIRSRRGERDRARAALAMIEAAVPTELSSLRFYKGSPEQYAAIVMSEGELLGTYCDFEVSARSRCLYDAVRGS